MGIQIFSHPIKSLQASFRALASRRSAYPVICLTLALCAPAQAQNRLADTVAKIKPSIVGVGTFVKTRNPSAVFTGTGFAVADGRHIVTNAHVLPRELDADRREALIVLVPGAEGPQSREARVVGTAPEHDLALIRIEGTPLPALALADSETAREGQSFAFTGFPVGMALGLVPATHRATLAAITPVVRPGITAKQLNPRMVNRIRNSPYVIFQLDGTAYPGNSGSPLYDPDTGSVYGIVNSVFIQGTRESAISRPSGITYAIPSAHVRELLERNNVPLQ